jgi:hypothetical protein
MTRYARYATVAFEFDQYLLSDDDDYFVDGFGK